MCTGAWLGWLMSGRGKAGYICVLRGNACALVRSVDDIYIYIYIYIQTKSPLSSLVRARCAHPINQIVQVHVVTVILVSPDRVLVPFVASWTPD